MFISILYLYFLEKFLSGAVFITQVCLWPSVHILSCTYLYLHCKGGLVCFGSAAFRKNKGPVDAEPEMESYQLVLDESLLWTNAVHKTCFCYIVQGLTKKVVFFYNPLSFLLPSPPPVSIMSMFKVVGGAAECARKLSRKSGTRMPCFELPSDCMKRVKHPGCLSLLYVVFFKHWYSFISSSGILWYQREKLVWYKSLELHCFHATHVFYLLDHSVY